MEDTRSHLETTKVLLVEETHVATVLEDTEEKLHDTATKVIQLALLFLSQSLPVLLCFIINCITNN